MKTITLYYLMALLLIGVSACKTHEERMAEKAEVQEGQFKVICKNDSGQVVLSAISKEKVERLKNGGVRFKDANGSYIIGKGECEVK